MSSNVALVLVRTHLCVKNWLLLCVVVIFVQLNSKEGFLTKLGFHRKVLEECVFVTTLCDIL